VGWGGRGGAGRHINRASCVRGSAIANKRVGVPTYAVVGHWYHGHGVHELHGALISLTIAAWTGNFGSSSRPSHIFLATYTSSYLLRDVLTAWLCARLGGWHM
jgi:hypothetical protein